METTTNHTDGANEFDELSLKHALQQEALKRAEFQLLHCPNISFIAIAGPTGVGKTHLLTRLSRNLIEHYASSDGLCASDVHCVSTVAVATGAKRFDWRRFYRDALHALSDPFAHTRPTMGMSSPGFNSIKESATAGELRENVEHELRLRRTKVWIIDEAQHLLTGGMQGAPGDQFDVIKSISQTTATKIVLCGTYQLPSYLSYSGQVMRRSATVHLPRYRFNIRQDRIVFVSVATTLFSKIGVPSAPRASEHVDFLYSGCLGCVGVLKDWLARARAMALYSGSDILAIEHLQSTMLSPNTLEEMFHEIEAGERLQSIDLTDSLVDKILGRITPKFDESPTRAVANKQPRRPGIRGPNHDLVPNRTNSQSNGGANE
jgi:DNA polymerase III delta prime subunit